MLEGGWVVVLVVDVLEAGVEEDWFVGTVESVWFVTVGTVWLLSVTGVVV